MKRITVEITDAAYAKVRTAMGVRVLSGHSPTAVDIFAALILEAIEAGEECKTIKTKEEREATS